MKQELQDKLFKKYPKIFRRKDLSPQETCMAWGIECGDGWYDIIYALCRCMQNHSTQVEIEQIKSKTGSLRIYTNCNHPYVQGIIQMAEVMSCTISEHSPCKK